MGDVIELEARAIDLEARLWNAYLRARDKAEQSRDIKDGVAAGKAWGAWLDYCAVHR